MLKLTLMGASPAPTLYGWASGSCRVRAGLAPALVILSALSCSSYVPNIDCQIVYNTTMSMYKMLSPLIKQ